MNIQKLQTELGQPTDLEQDARKGISAVWGAVSTGAFWVSRGPIDETYEVGLCPAPPTHREREKHNFSEEELNTWFDQNVKRIKEVLQGI